MRSAKTVSVLATALAAGAWLSACGDNPQGPPLPGPQPFVIIDRPPAAAGIPWYADVVVFGWSGYGSSSGSVRHLFSEIVDTTGAYDPSFDIIGDLNANPWRYEIRWSPWIASGAPGDSGTATIIGDDESLELGKAYLFAVQAKDKRGNTTSVFDGQINARLFKVKSVMGPLLLMIEQYLGGLKFIGVGMNPVWRSFPPGFPIIFRWRANAQDYGGEVAGYRHGWDIENPNEWDAPFSIVDTFSTEVRFFCGFHVLSVEAIDQAGNISRGAVRISIVPFPMDRNLLWVDDFFSANHPIPDYSYPPEYDHDDFWTNICSRAQGFEPERDVYDCYDNRTRPPGMDYIGRYKNVIWTYSTSSDTWHDIIRFIPESRIGEESYTAVNYLSMFMKKGGHLWTLGRSDQSGGFSASLPTSARIYPMSLRCETTGNRNDCWGDNSGVNSMAYADYCVSVLDKIQGTFRRSADMPKRTVNHYDVLTHAYKDESDPVTAMFPGLPRRLDLWEEVTKPGRFFDPDSSSVPGGFTYVEIYDPRYWMVRKLGGSQPCFHPMYRMRAKNEESVVDNSTIAIWSTKYSDIIPEVASGVAVGAPSVHFGFPLWFFEREAADSIADVIFTTWGISAPR